MRTKNDFPDVNKYHKDNTPEGISEIKKKENVYIQKKNLRKSTKGTFAENHQVKRVLQ